MANKVEGVFISYKMTDNSFKIVKFFSEIFKMSGIKCYAAGLDKKYGISIHQTIIKEIQESSHLIVLINDDLINNDNGWIIKEIGMAEGLEKTIVPVIATKNYPIKKLLDILLIDNNLKALPMPMDSNDNDFIESINSTFGTSLSPSIMNIVSNVVKNLELDKIDEKSIERVANQIKNETQSKAIQFTYNVIKEPTNKAKNNSINELVALGILTGIIILGAWLISHKK
ncbi:MAG: toll/interleukin-1 receptor domain-containing protein [Thermotogae bacterium]|nr:toll/interleukin-1 receptor domain-containing protein [Thermotogota bacterium]